MFETHGGTRNRTRDLPKKGSAFVTSSDHWIRTDVTGLPVLPQLCLPAPTTTMACHQSSAQASRGREARAGRSDASGGATLMP